MQFLALIPARYASSRFPGKPLALIGGKPMIQHVYERVVQAFDQVWVATDDSRIEQAVQAFGGRVVMTSTEHRSGTDRCVEALNRVEHSTGLRFDVVVNVQGDEPFIAVEQLEQIRGCFDDPATQIATLVKPFAAGEEITNPNTPKVVRGMNGQALYFSRSPIPYLRGVDPARWADQITYYKHIGLYAYRSETLRSIAALPPSPLELAESLEQLRWLENGLSIRTAVTDVESHAVDTPEDLERVKQFLE